MPLLPPFKTVRQSDEPLLFNFIDHNNTENDTALVT